MYLYKFNSNSKFFFLIVVQCIYISCKQFSNAEDFDYETQYVIYTHKKINRGGGRNGDGGGVIGFHFVLMYINVTSLHVDRSQFWLLRKC